MVDTGEKEKAPGGGQYYIKIKKIPDPRENNQTNNKPKTEPPGRRGANAEEPAEVGGPRFGAKLKKKLCRRDHQNKRRGNESKREIVLQKLRKKHRKGKGKAVRTQNKS